MVVPQVKVIIPLQDLLHLKYLSVYCQNPIADPQAEEPYLIGPLFQVPFVLVTDLNEGTNNGCVYLGTYVLILYFK